MLYDQVSLLRAASGDGTFAISVTGDNTQCFFLLHDVQCLYEARAMVRHLRDGYCVTIYVIHSESFLLHQHHLPTSCSSFLHRALEKKENNQLQEKHLWFEIEAWGNTIFFTMVTMAASIWSKIQQYCEILLQFKITFLFSCILKRKMQS